MPKRALMERRPWLLASLTAAIAYYWLKGGNFPGVYLYLIEAAAFILLSAYALLRLADTVARQLAGVMALAGIGAVIVELHPYIGALVLMFSHVLAISVLLSRRREEPTPSQRYTAVALLILTPIIIWQATSVDGLRLVATIYGLAAGGMAAAAWASGFPRYRVGAGAVLVVFASLASILGAGLLSASPVPGLIAWPLFYLGHFLLCTGVVQTLRSVPCKPDLRVVN